MFTKQELKEFCDNARLNFVDHISIDCVIFGFHEGQLKVLVLKMKDEDAWYLPGGFVLKKEPI
ncbi:MAG: NUDIX hydrolase, partial [Bacteroidetes bacterium]|nr:NUDIX hydrolase [Bacteroidota bacterium]